VNHQINLGSDQYLRQISTTSNCSRCLAEGMVDLGIQSVKMAFAKVKDPPQTCSAMGRISGVAADQPRQMHSQIKSGLMIVDQHVAHERILYERALRSLEDNHPVSQQLLFPQHIDLVPRELALIRELLPELERIGFQLRFFGGMSLIIDGIPADVHSGREESILREVLESYEEFGETKTLSGREALAASFGCKAAIKAGDKLSQEEMHVLIEQLFQTQMPYVCPHGRPIVIKLAIDELDRRFGRSPVENMAKAQASV